MEIKIVNIIGSGNVASFIAQRLHSKVLIKSIYSRDLIRALDLAGQVSAVGVNKISSLNDDVDLNIICVNDDKIIELAGQLPKSIPVAHTSGATDTSVLKEFRDYGTLYPLQTISKDRISKLHDVPFLIEANASVFEGKLLTFAHRYLSNKSIVVDSDARRRIHVAAVFANNFSNFFLVKAKQILDQKGIDFRILEPLMIETIQKGFEIGPKKSQTGPALRGDLATINTHLSLIEDESLKAAYTLISELIQKEFNS